MILYVLSFGLINFFDVGTNYPAHEQIDEIINNNIPIIIEQVAPIIDEELLAIINNNIIAGEITVNGDIVQVIEGTKMYQGSIEEFKLAYEAYLEFQVGAANYIPDASVITFTHYIEEMNNALEMLHELENVGE